MIYLDVIAYTLLHLDITSNSIFYSILGPANDRRRYKVTQSLICWAQT